MRIAHRKLIALATLGAGCSLALVACSNPSTSPNVTANDRTRIAEAEARKWDMFFGSPAQRDSVAAWFDSVCVNVGATATGVVRVSCANERVALAAFPTLPAGTFAVTNMQVVGAGTDALVTSYELSGPGPTGAPIRMWVASVWVRHGTDWKTVYYQASPGAE